MTGMEMRCARRRISRGRRGRRRVRRVAWRRVATRSAGTRPFETVRVIGRTGSIGVSVRRCRTTDGRRGSRPKTGVLVDEVQQRRPGRQGRHQGRRHDRRVRRRTRPQRSPVHAARAGHAGRQKSASWSSRDGGQRVTVTVAPSDRGGRLAVRRRFQPRRASPSLPRRRAAPMAAQGASSPAAADARDARLRLHLSLRRRAPRDHRRGSRTGSATTSG